MAGSPNLYRLRVYNPCLSPRTVRVVIEGRRNDASTSAFHFEWPATLAAGASVERWVQSTWRGDSMLLGTPPSTFVLPGVSGISVASWTVEAYVMDEGGDTQDMLHIGGTLA